MRILYIQDSLGTGGAERSNAELWYYLRAKDIELRIVALEHRKEGIEQEIIEAGFDVVFLRQASFINQANQIKNAIKNFKPDIVHSVLFRANMRVRLVKLFYKFRHVESLVNCTYDEIRYQDANINSMLLKVYEKLDGLSQNIGVDHFLAITNEVKNHYIKHLNIKPKKLTVISRGRKENQFRSEKKYLRMALNKELDLDYEGLIFIHVGRQEFQKAHLDILKAIKIIDKELAIAKAQFLFCGRKGNATGEIDDFLKQNVLSTRVEFLGHRNDVYQLMVASDVFLFPSRFEGLGGSLIEAQAAGLPVICSDIPVFKEVVSPLNAKFHKTNDPKSLSLVLKEMIFQNNLEEMGKISLKNYNENFQLGNINRKMLEFYYNILL